MRPRCVSPALMEFTRMFRGPSSFASTRGGTVHRAFRCRVDRSCRGKFGASYGANVDDAAALFTKSLYSSFGGRRSPSTLVSNWR